MDGGELFGVTKLSVLVLALIPMPFAFGCSTAPSNGSPPSESGSLSSESPLAPSPLPSPSTAVVADPGPRPIVWGFVGTGQSLAIGAAAGAPKYEPPLPTAGEGHFVLRNITGGAETNRPFAFAKPASAWTLETLVEPIREIGSGTGPWPINVSYQSPHAPLADELRRLSGGTILTAHIVAAQNGQGMAGIGKGGSVSSYAASLAEAERMRDLLAARGYELRFAAILLTHGETDHGNHAYDDDVARLQADYEADLRAITGQGRRIPLFMTHPSAGYINPPAGMYNTTTMAMTRAWRRAPTTLRLVGSKTNLEYFESDFHLSPAGTIALGRLYARHVYPWIANESFVDPVHPVSIVRTGRTVTITADRPLVDDPALFGATHHEGPWQDALGFEAHDAEGNDVRIERASLRGNAVVLECATSPAEVSHAMYADGPTPVSRRVRLRDAGGEWLVQFLETF